MNAQSKKIEINSDSSVLGKLYGLPFCLVLISWDYSSNFEQNSLLSAITFVSKKVFNLYENIKVDVRGLNILPK